MTIRTRASLVALLLLGACQTALPPAVHNDPVTLTGAESAAVEAGVRGALKDPVSAMFEGFMAVRDAKGVITVCGLVNAKNSFGGYTGRKPFIGIITTGGTVTGFVPAGIGGSDIATEVILNNCHRVGIPISA